MHAEGAVSFDVRAGISIGGISPVPLPVEIRKINSFSTDILPSFEVGMTDMLSEKWGVRTAVRFETDGMCSSANVKTYRMSITGEDGTSLEGYWTGDVDINAKNFLITLPVTAAYRISDRFSIDLGPYVSYLLNGTFDGKSYDGYIRLGDPTGDKVVFSGNACGRFDFSDEYVSLQYGLSLTATYDITGHLLAAVRLKWGLNHVFRSSFKTIGDRMYPVFGNVSVGYRF